MSSYIGRFAPSPTGELHAGSLACAIASYIDARAHDGKWIIRIENIDPPREKIGAALSQIQTLAFFGMRSDAEILYQSNRLTAYERVLQNLKDKGYVYGCSCSRKSIAEAQLKRGLPANIYPGTCRNGCDADKIRAWRFRVDNVPVCFTDRFYGPIEQRLEDEVGDFVLKRADGFWAYQLAVVVDDAYQDVTHIVRGADLLSNTARQIALQKALGYPTPHYLHIPIVVNQEGEKLSKQSGAKPLDLNDRNGELLKAWIHFGFEPFSFASPQDFFTKAVECWKKSRFFQDI